MAPRIRSITKSYRLDARSPWGRRAGSVRTGCTAHCNDAEPRTAHLVTARHRICAGRPPVGQADRSWCSRYRRAIRPADDNCPYDADETVYHVAQNALSGTRDGCMRSNCRSIARAVSRMNCACLNLGVEGIAILLYLTQRPVRTVARSITSRPIQPLPEEQLAPRQAKAKERTSTLCEV